MSTHHRLADHWLVDQMFPYTNFNSTPYHQDGYPLKVTQIHAVYHQTSAVQICQNFLKVHRICNVVKLIEFCPMINWTQLKNGHFNAWHSLPLKPKEGSVARKIANCVDTQNGRPHCFAKTVLYFRFPYYLIRLLALFFKVSIDESQGQAKR